MGNCQAIDAAALVIQHPCGKIERLYWSISASEVMRLNPGHYVSLIIPLPVSNEDKSNHQNDDNNKKREGEQDGQVKTVRFTRVKLLRPSETLALGHAYRLVTTQEVMKVLKAKKYAKAAKKQLAGSDDTDHDDVEVNHDLHQSSSVCVEERKSEKKTSQAAKSDGQRQRVSSGNGGVTRSKSWRPSLQSISEASG